VFTDPMLDECEKQAEILLVSLGKVLRDASAFEWLNWYIVTGSSLA